MQIIHLKHALDRTLSLRPATTAASHRAPSSDPKSLVSFRCNICGNRNTTRLETLEREAVSCSGCGSTVRFRAMIDLLLNDLFESNLRLDKIPVRKDIAGVGLSDSDKYALPLPEKFDYPTPYYHCNPRLDIANP